VSGRDLTEWSAGQRLDPPRRDLRCPLNTAGMVLAIVIA
jgi:hypothetical protein